MNVLNAHSTTISTIIKFAAKLLPSAKNLTGESESVNLAILAMKSITANVC